MEELRAECASKIPNDLETTPMAKVLGIDKASTVHEMKIGPWTKVENVHDEHHNEDLTSGDIHREGDLLLLIDHSSTNIINDGKFIMINKLPNVVMDDEDRIEESTLEICATKCIGYKDGLSVLFVMNLKSYQHLWDALFDPRNLAVIRYTFTDHKVSLFFYTLMLILNFNSVVGKILVLNSTH